MNRIAKFFSITALSLLVLGLPAIASAQYGGYGYPSGGGYGYPSGGGYGYPNGGYGNYGSYGDQRSLVRSLKDKTREFQRQLDRDLDNSRYNGTRQEDEINRMAKDFRNAVNDLDSNGRDYNRIQRVEITGSQLDRLMSGRGGRIGYNTQQIWQSIRYDLQQLGGGNYNNGRGGRNNTGTWGSGGYNNGRPSWWPF